jgi:magnesium transporter
LTPDMFTYTSTGVRRALTAAEKKNPARTVAAADRAGGFVWVGIVNPDENQMEELGESFDLHPLAVRDASTGKQQPKVQSYQQHLFIAMWALLYSNPNDTVKISDTFLFVRPGLLLTVQRHDGRHRVDFGKVLDESLSRVPGKVMSGVYAIMANVVDGYTEVSSVIEKELEAVEDQVFDPNTQNEAGRIYRLRKQIGKVNRAVSAIAVALEKSRDHFTEMSVGGEDVEPYLQDLMDDLVGTDQLTSDQNAALEGVIATHENSVASQQNSDTRKISALAAMLAIPAVIAGLCGMNFKNLPGINWVYGWEAAIAVTVIIEVVLFVNFKRRQWL